MRGLKLFVLSLEYAAKVVASFTDAWIETIRIKVSGLIDGSHLLQMRGLKLNGYNGLSLG